MQSKDVFARISKSLKFLPSALHKLIHANVVGSLDISSFNNFYLEDLERTINLNNQLTSCKAVFQYNKAKSDKITFTIRFKKGIMKSILWSA